MRNRTFERSKFISFYSSLQLGCFCIFVFSHLWEHKVFSLSSASYISLCVSQSEWIYATPSCKVSAHHLHQWGVEWIQLQNMREVLDRTHALVSCYFLRQHNLVSIKSMEEVKSQISSVLLLGPTMTLYIFSLSLSLSLSLSRARRRLRNNDMYRKIIIETKEKEKYAPRIYIHIQWSEIRPCQTWNHYYMNHGRTGSACPSFYKWSV